jgi:hypothetical protein
LLLQTLHEIVAIFRESARDLPLGALVLLAQSASLFLGLLALAAQVFQLLLPTTISLLTCLAVRLFCSTSLLLLFCSPSCFCTSAFLCFLALALALFLLLLSLALFTHSSRKLIFVLLAPQFLGGRSSCSCCCFLFLPTLSLGLLVVNLVVERRPLGLVVL